MAVQAVDEMKMKAAVLLKKRSDIKKAERLQPEVIGGEIINPGIYEEDVLFRRHLSISFLVYGTQFLFKRDKFYYNVLTNDRTLSGLNLD